MIGILSDSHDHIEHIQKAVALFEEKKVVRIIHAGDVCSPFVWPFFRNLHVPIHCVLGNNAGDVVRQQAQAKKFGLDIQFDPFFMEIDHSKRKIAVHHGDPYSVVEAVAACQKYDLVVYGHNHVPKIHSVGKTQLVNPGSLVTKIKSPLSVLQGPNNPGPSVALYDPVASSAKIIFL